MQINKTFHRGMFVQSVFAFSIAGLSLLQACGSAYAVRPSSDAASNTASNNSHAKSDDVQALEGTWLRACDANKSPTEEKLTVKDGRFTQEIIGYQVGCKEQTERFVYSGTFKLGDAAVNPQELTFESGNFALKPAAIQGIRNIDFTIDEWTMEFDGTSANQDGADLEKLMSECPALKVERSTTVVRIQRNGCELESLNHRLFDIVAVNQEKIRLGLYLGDLNSFDPKGKTTQEFRSNVISNLPMARVK